MYQRLCVIRFDVPTLTRHYSPRNVLFDCHKKRRTKYNFSHKIDYQQCCFVNVCFVHVNYLRLTLNTRILRKVTIRTKGDFLGCSRNSNTSRQIISQDAYCIFVLHNSTDDVGPNSPKTQRRLPCV